MAAAEEQWRWQCVSEESLLLHDDLVKLADHIPLPTGVAVRSGGSSNEADYGLPLLDGKSPQELATVIHSECAARSTTFSSLMEYRLNALRCLWASLRKPDKKDTTSPKKGEESADSQSKQNQQHSEQFSSRISLLLIFPTLRSLSRLDPQLSQDTASILLHTLQDCEPVSLSKEPGDCIAGLEDLLCSWIRSAEKEEMAEKQLKVATSALVALTVAVGTGSMLLRTVDTLQSLLSTRPLLELMAPAVLHKLLKGHVAQEEPSAIVAGAHLLSWDYDTQHVEEEKENGVSHSIAFDGQFVYVTSSNGRKVLKVGSGLGGTLRSYVYTNTPTDGGWLVYCQDKLLMRRTDADDKTEEPFCAEMDRSNLRTKGVVSGRGLVDEPHTTLNLLSDGLRLYWLYALKAVEQTAHPILPDEKIKRHAVYLQTLLVEEGEAGSMVVPCGERLLIQRGLEDKSTEVMKSLMRSGGAYTSPALSSLLGGGSGGNKDEIGTSMGLSLKQIQSCACYCSGSSLVLIVPPPPANSRSLFSSTSTPSSKALAVSHCYSLSSGQYITQTDLSSCTQLHCALSRGGSTQTTAACYDSINHCVWTVSDDWVDVWSCAGRVRPAAHLLAVRMNHGSVSSLIPSPSQGAASTLRDTIDLLLRHSGMESCRLVPSQAFSRPVEHNLKLTFLRHVLSIVQCSVEEKSWNNVLANIITLQAVLPGFISSQKHQEDSQLAVLLCSIRDLVWKLAVMDDCPAALLKEIRHLICKNSHQLLIERKEEDTLTLLSTPSLAPLRQDLLLETVRQLRQSSDHTHQLLKTVSPLVSCSLTRDSLDTLRSVVDCSEDELPSVTAMLPVFPPSLQCATAFLSSALRGLASCAQDNENVMEDARRNLINTCQQLTMFEACQETLELLLSLASSLPPVTESDEEVLDKRHHRLAAMERACKSTAVGCLLPPLLALASDQQLGSLSLTNTLLESLSPLEKLVAEVCSLLYPSQQRVSIPAPWASGRMIDTIHPVRDNYKFKETISFPGARHLFLKFDSRCSSQYDYDKVMIYAGDSSKSPKVAEYGGNTHGFGSRSVLGKGWPKDLVKVDGDTVTIMFEMKSGREHSTPDKAMWGFACTVRPQELAEDGSNGLPFLLDLLLSLSSVNCSLIGQLFSGAPPTKQELRCEAVMESALLQRCVWHEEPVKVLAREPLPPVVVQKLRGKAGQVQPTLRPSIRELLRVDELEEVIVSVCLKHHGVDSPLGLLRGEKVTPSHQQLLQNLFTYINGLERRLQALAELEARWKGEVLEMGAERMIVAEAFFFDLLQQESSYKSFELLCCLKSVQLLSGDLFAAAKQLQELLERDIERARSSSSSSDEDMYVQTGVLVKGVIERAKLLLHVRIAPQPDDTPPVISRSVSTPTAVAESRKQSLRRQRSMGAGSQTVLVDVPSDTAQQTLLDEIFLFIGSKPEEAVSIEVFLSAAQNQRERGTNRVKALEHLHRVLTSRHHLGFAVKHILACVSPVLLHGPQVKDIVCSGLVQPVRDAFAIVMQSVAKLASQQPVACINTIALLCTVPYTRDEEACLVRSGLVKLLDKLCCLSDLPKDPALPEDGEEQAEDEEEEEEAVHRVTALAWAAFQVLADRCVSWETKSSGFISSGLAQQVSLLLTNHLSRAMESLAVSETGASDTLQEALSMLLGLARSHMGRTILSQPACVSKLLLLLTDQRPSPKLVLIVLQLCRVALPLMSIDDCNKVSIPHHPTLSSSPSNGNQMATSTITLLMAKLAEYIVPITSPVPVQTKPVHEATPTDDTPSLSHPQEEVDESGQAAVVLYRRDNEGAADLLHMLLNQDPRQLGHRMESVLQLDHTLHEDGKVEVFTDSYRSCQRRALRWANIGFTVSIEPPSGAVGRSSGTETDRKKAKIEAACRKKNLELLKTDPPRPFLSGMVAYSLASEIIGLLNGLLAEEEAVLVWRDAISAVLDTSLTSIPSLIPRLADYCCEVHSSITSCSPLPSPDDLLSPACLANATFAALGGFKASIQPGMVVTILGNGIARDCQGTVASISERRGIANIVFEDDDLCFVANKTLEVSLSRLSPPEVGSLPVQQLELQESLCAAIKSVLSSSPLSCKTAQSQVDASVPAMGLCRLLAELRTRVALSLSHHSQQAGLRERLLNCCNTDQLLKQAQSCDPGQRLSVVEAHCVTLRMLYRDSSRPPPPIVESQLIEPKKFYWDVSRLWPSVHSCCFSHHLSCVTYQGPSTTTTSSTAVAGEDAQNSPRGVLIITTAPIPDKAPSFYWELEVCHLDTGSNAAHITLGYCPEPQKPAEGQQWSYLEETCLLRSTGRGCQVRGEDRMQWDKIALENPLTNGDVVGCGWVRGEAADGKGTVYFTLNGTCHPTKFNGVPGKLYPFVHLQKKSTRVRANFGESQFRYAEGQAHRLAANIPDGDTEEEIAAIFRLLPFADVDFADIDGDQPKREEKVPEVAKEEQEEATPAASNGTPSHKLQPPSPGESYQVASSLLHAMETSYSNILECGPLVRPGGWDRGEEPEEEGTESSSPQDEDLHSLLVKAWETKVFPVIQRRFRNDQERKSGLEQIRGALQLGMETIAQETVEFLYEENGGLPRDLHLPTMDDVKAELDKFTISRVKKGQVVVVRKDLPYARCGVRAMQKTLGLTGVVLGVDKPNDLVQVECYLSSEGALVRFWFPVLDLERPPKGFRKPAALKGVESTHIIVHRELLNCEAALFSMYCRSALLSLYPPSSCSSSPNGWVTQFSLLANQCFAQPSVEGHSSTSSPLLANSLHSSLLSVLPSPHSLFFTECSILEEEVVAALSTHGAALHHLANGVCSGLTSSPLPFGLTTLSVAESKETMDISSPSSAFLVVSCPEEKIKASFGAQYKFPWAKVFCSRGANGKSGRMALQEVARYPSQLSSQQYCGPVLPSLLLPTSSCHLRLGGCSPIPGRQLSIMGVSPSLPTALVFADTLSTVTCRLANPVSKGLTSPTAEHLRALQTCLNSLSTLLVQVDTPPVLKEKLFQCVSGILWTLHSSCSLPSLSAEFTASLHQELQKLYDLETGGNGSPIDHRPRSRQSPLPSSSGSSKSSVGMFSTYLQSLTELVIATNMCCSPPSPSSPVSPDITLDTIVTKRKKSKKRKDWLVYASSLLVHLHQGTSLPLEFYNCLYKTLPVRPQSRLLLVTGINPSLDLAAVQQTLTHLCSQHGGLDTDNLFISSSIVDDKLVVGGAVLELCSLHKCSIVSECLYGSLELQGDNKELAVVTVFDNLSCEEEEDGPAKGLLREYLQSKLADSNGQLVERAQSVLCEVFTSHSASKEDSLLLLFVRGVSAGNGHQELLDQLSKLSQDGYLNWAEQQIKEDPISVWRGLLAVGYDLHLVRCGFSPAEAAAQCQPSQEQDHALVLHVDAQCRRLAITSSQLHSWDITITDTDLVSQDLALLQGLSLADLRLRFLQLKHINRQLSQLLPLVDMRCTHPLSLGSRMRQTAPLLFYDVKISFLHNVLNTATRRSLDQPPPEIKMDPLETVAGVSTSAAATQFCQSANQMLSVPSPQLCVPLASGGDPTYAFNVKLSGEEVHGTSGSFRHFLWQVVRELQSPVLPLLAPCPSSAAGINKGKHILAPRPMTYSEEKLLEFLGQLLGVAMRADVPMALDLLPCFWKSLQGEPLSLSDLQEADYLTYTFTQQLLEAKDQSAFSELVSGMGQAVDEGRTARGLVFTRTTLAGEEEELCDNGAARTVRYEDRHEYVAAVRCNRLRELSCEDRMAAVRCGLGSVVPLQLLSLLTPHDLDMRVCGLPIIDLNYLKRHTTYHVGLMESDQHIQYFWKALDSLSQEELRKFIKFACNQERIPFGHPCREGGEPLTHVPPYPMKIAPPDGTDQPDSRYIRAETCMFLVKLPQYTSQDVMTERLRYAINCREDPLSG